MRTTRNFNSSVFNALYGMLENESWVSRSSGHAMPAINIIDSEKKYELEYAVPGMSKEDFNIQVDSDNRLIISVEKNNPVSSDDAERRYLRQGFRIPAFRQSLTLPEDVDREAIAARVENGILYITLPKLQPEVVKPEVRTIGIA